MKIFAFFTVFFAFSNIFSADFYISTKNYSDAARAEETAFAEEGIIIEDSSEQRYLDFYSDVVPRAIFECSEKSISVQEIGESETSFPVISLDYNEDYELSKVNICISCDLSEDSRVSYDFSMSNYDYYRINDVAVRFVSDFIEQFSNKSSKKYEKSFNFNLIDYFSTAEYYRKNAPGIFLAEAKADGSFAILDASGTRLFDKNGDFVAEIKAEDSPEKNAPEYNCEFEGARDFCDFGGGTAFLLGNALFFADKNAEISKVVFLENGENFSILCATEGDSVLASAKNAQNEIAFEKISADGGICEAFKIPDSFGEIKFLSHCENMYIFCSYTKNILIRMTDKLDSIDENLQKISNISERIINSKSIAEKIPLYKENAQIYSDFGGNWLAVDNYSKYLEFCPKDAVAAEKKVRAECALFAEEAEAGLQKTLAILEESGKDKARGEYSKTVKSVKKILRYFPDDSKANEILAALKTAFGESVSEQSASISAEDFSFGAVFPALKNFYETESAGFVCIKNNSENAIKNVRAQISVKKYINSSSYVMAEDEILPGNSAKLPIYISLAEDSLALQEKTIKQAKISIIWEENEIKKKYEFERPVFILGKNAMDWENLFMFSRFVQPKNKNIKDFTSKICVKYENDFKISKNISQAVFVANALNSFLSYIPDETAPAAELSDAEFAAGTVRFPTETLKNGGGDSSDLTAVFCSCLESAGVATALIKTGGHIFAAFNSGLESKIAFGSENLAVFEFGGAAWIPVEIASMKDGFFESWKIASKEILESDENQFIEISKARESFPEENFGKADSPIKIDEEKVFENSALDYEKIKFEILAVLEKRSEEADSADALNKIAKYFHLLGEDETAIELLESALEKEKYNSAIYKNLANLYSLQGDGIDASPYAAMASTMNALSFDSLFSDDEDEEKEEDKEDDEEDESESESQDEKNGDFVWEE